MKLLPIAVLLLAACDGALANEVPLPRARPAPSHAAPAPAPPAARPAPAAPVPEVLPLHDGASWPSNCALQLAEIARFTHQPSVNGPGQCGASDIVRLEKIVMPNGTLVVVAPSATLRCSMAAAVAQWVRSDLGPAAADLGSPLAAVTNHGSYECRSRNNAAGARISQHAHGNALDLGMIRLIDGVVIDLAQRDLAQRELGQKDLAQKDLAQKDLAQKSIPQSFSQRIRDATCNRFKTVLGPGSDASHADHIHVDLAERARGYAMCQWDVEPRQ
jgi:hypothetical protein